MPRRPSCARNFNSSGDPFAGLRVKELITQIRIFQSVGKADEATRLMKTYGEVFSKPMPADLAKMNVRRRDRARPRQ